VDEFSLIERYFDVQTPPASVVLGIGDDTAILKPPSTQDLLVTTDTLVSGVHFPAETHPAAIGHKALAVNLSDIAAMGGEPAWFTLALTIPDIDEGWLEAFSASLHELARRYDVSLVGGDTTRGPLSITVTMIGTVTEGKAIKRSNAKPGDAVFVTGSLGDAALALHCLQNDIEIDAAIMARLREALDEPMPRIDEGRILRNHASAMIDISDGLVADLGHILSASSVAAEMLTQQLPLSQNVLEATNQAKITTDRLIQFALTGGDDYELCVAVPESQLSALQQSWSPSLAPLTRVGTITTGSGLKLYDADGQSGTSAATGGYTHFDEHTD
jgi:thiamine-monophosphate kinase